MEDSSTRVTCPRCDTADTPILVVRGTEVASSPYTLRCRSCRTEWVRGAGDRRAAS